MEQWLDCDEGDERPQQVSTPTCPPHLTTTHTTHPHNTIALNCCRCETTVLHFCSSGRHWFFLCTLVLPRHEKIQSKNRLEITLTEFSLFLFSFYPPLLPLFFSFHCSHLLCHLCLSPVRFSRSSLLSCHLFLSPFPLMVILFFLCLVPQLMMLLLCIWALKDRLPSQQIISGSS